MDEKEIQRRIEEKLDSVDLTEDDLTIEELRSLREEVIAEMNGETILDGVLSNADILYRKPRTTRD